jgi:putative ABC transport system ATP-binding protein
MVSTLERPVVHGAGLQKSFRRDAEIVHALRGVDISVAPGEIVGISGASGSGKSTLLAVLCGWETPDTGRVEHVGGVPVSLAWSELSLVPQTLGLLEDLTVLENVLLPARLTKAVHEYTERADALMQRLNIARLAERFPAQISQGEQQRTSIARALLLRPRLLLADEPTAHQDHALADVVLDCLREHVAAGGACIMVTHHLQALERTDRVLSMSDGVLYRNGR